MDSECCVVLANVLMEWESVREYCAEAHMGRGGAVRIRGAIFGVNGDRGRVIDVSTPGSWA